MRRQLSQSPGGGSARRASVTGVSSCGTVWLTNRDVRRRGRSPAWAARLRLGDVGGVANRHRLADGQGAVAGQGAVRLEHVGHEVDVGLVAERALGPGGHRVAQVLEQLVGGLPRPRVQELDAGQRRRDHALEADAVALAALDAVGRPAARRLVRGEGAVRARGLRRRDADARPGGQTARRDQADDRRPRDIPPSPTRPADFNACSLRHDPHPSMTSARDHTPRGRPPRRYTTNPPTAL